MLIYTSGTTGQPKGAVHVHGGFPIKAAQDLAHTFDLRAGDALFWFTDLGWMMGPWAISGSLLLGARLVLYEGAPDYPGPGPPVGARRAAPRDPPRPVPDGRPGADPAWNGTGPEPRPLVAARPRLDRRAVGSGELVVVLPRGRRRPLPVVNYSGGTEVSGGIVGCNLLTPIKPASFNGPCIGHGGRRRRRRRPAAPRRGRRARDPGAPARHDPRFLDRPGALRRDVRALN